MSAADANRNFSALLRQVREGQSCVITSHGKPVAKLVPYVESKPRKGFGALKGTVLKYERPFDPIDGEWDVNKPDA